MTDTVTTRRQNRQRADDQTTITFSCSRELKEKIRSAADEERRSISNWVVYQLEQAISEAQAFSTPQPKLRRVAEGREEYGS